MADRPQTNRARGLAKTVAKFAASWLVVYLAANNAARVFRFEHAVVPDAIYRVLSGFPSVAILADRIAQDFIEIFSNAFGLTLFFATGFGLLGAAARMIARARIRAGQEDFLDRARAWTTARPNATRALLAVPALVWVLFLAWPGRFELNHVFDQWLPGLVRAALPTGIAAWGIFAMTRKGLRELLAPTAGGGETQTRFEIGADEIVFDAVAVTSETLAMVAIFTAITLAVPAFIWTRPILDLFRETSIFYLVGAYIAFAAIGAIAFRKASRISVGLDGVHVRGTSRARFYAYRDLDAARVEGNDLELVRGDRVVLRLQLHGEDASRRDAVLARIREAIDRVKEGRGAISAQLVSAATTTELARAAEGGADYRGAALTRQQLWALVEGPEIEASARKAAAEALARSSDEAEHARLRVAAEHCAEPAVRVALEKLADAESMQDVASPPDREALARRSA